MGFNLRVFLIIGIIFYLYIIFSLLKKKKLNLKYTLIWLFSALVMLIIAIFPKIIFYLSHMIGIIDETNTVFVLEGMFVLIILLSLTSIVSHLNNKNQELIQEVALLDKRLREFKQDIILKFDLEKKHEK